MVVSNEEDGLRTMARELAADNNMVGVFSLPLESLKHVDRTHILTADRSKRQVLSSQGITESGIPSYSCHSHQL